MSKNRPALLTLVLLGAIGPGAAWSTPDTAAGEPAAAKAQTPADLRARLIELRNRQQAAPKDPELSYQLGALYLDAGDPKAAEEQLERAIEEGTTAADAWVLLGQAWLLQDKFVEIQAQIPTDEIPDPAVKAGVVVLQGLAWLAKDRPNDARASFQEALTLEPDLSSAYLGFARVSMAEGNGAAAAEALTSAAGGVRPDQAEIETLRGELAQANKDLPAAERAFQAALDAKPYQYWRRRQLAHTQVAQNKLDAADANLTAILAARPGDLAATYLSAFSAYLRGDYQRAYDSISPLLKGQVEEPGALFVAGAAAYQLGNYNQARELLTLYLPRQPADANARAILAAALLRLGEPQEALATLKPLLGANPDAGVLALAGQAATLGGEPKEAVTYLERALALSPQDAGFAGLLGAARIAAGDRKAGIAELEKLVAAGGNGLQSTELALLRERLKAGDLPGLVTAAERFTKRYPKSPDGPLLRGIAQARTGALPAAKASFEQVLKLSPNNLDALIGLADVSLRQGDLAGAETAMGRALEQKKGDPLLLRNFANIALAAGKPDQAVARLEQARQSNPDNQALVTLLAAVYTSAGRPLDALQILADKGDPKDPAVLTERSRAELRAGRVAAAVADARAVIELQPESADAYLNLGRALEQEPDLVKAQAAYEKARTLRPDDTAAAAIGIARTKMLGLGSATSEQTATQVADLVARTLEANPAGAEATRLRALVSVAAAKPGQAIQLLKPLHAVDPDAGTVYQLAMSYVQAKDPRGGIAILKQHVERYPKDLAVRLALARHLMADKQYASAVAELNKLLEQDWGHTDAQIDLAAALIQAGRPQEAKTHLAEATKARPKDMRIKLLQQAAEQKSGPGK
ncbi:XrtA/PEP-CTERM system TPR-repeat protein PrsT [Candidatus Thiodictyon syntrophicum]|uniref:XrtA/PEP-CTERM system TPR-repeat protein PrsT n=1 Tax=Candidatus Thiodictyon syntrophicum TaxID=1166950 RepID=UPI0012FD523C|nr:XrtA/PEP-CTERM system TPR-repeat protein PrsT [Candidatus Thiodictyon syntrophicum]